MKKRTNFYWVIAGIAVFVLMVFGLLYFYPKNDRSFGYVFLIFIPLFGYLIVIFVQFSSLLLKRITSERESLLKRQENIINSLHDGLIVFDLGGRILAVNPKIKELFWVSEKELAGKRPEELDEKKNKLLENIKKISLLKLNNFQKKEFDIASPDKKFLEVVVVPLKEGDRKVGTIRIIHDITENKETELLRSNIITTVAHQLRTPLSGIKWTMDMFLNGELGQITAEQQNYLKKSSKAAEELIGIVRDLLDLTKIKQGLFQKLDFIDVYNLIWGVLKEFKNPAGEKNISIKIKEPPLLFPKILNNEETLQIALRNIIDNAISYTPKNGSIEIILRQENENIVIGVKDTGIGIPKDEQKYIFNQFFRGTNAVKTKTEGSGLGLSIAKDIVSHFNGKIWFESEENKGSVFYIALPVKP